MFRLRRYRLFLVVAALTTLSVYHLTRVRHWEVPDIDSLTKFGQKSVVSTSRPAFEDTTVSTTRIDSSRVTPPLSTAPVAYNPATSSIYAALRNSDLTRQEQSANTPPLTSTGSSPVASVSLVTTTIENRIEEEEKAAGGFEQHGQGRLEVTSQPPEQTKIHWQPQPEHFPIPPELLKPVPTGSARRLPRIQYDFKPESDLERTGRLQRLKTIKASFQHAWTGYATLAMPHDELKPTSKKVSDPFNGWGATLVDSLDSLWIMGMKDEFEQAVGYVSKIDFTTSTRKDIPLFETVIRYLGGLVAAYDLSGAKYLILLDKAVELADILMGAFDTPNRMPLTYYIWAPSYVSQPHRANSHVVLAEIGSLSVEFTRLAQITKEARFYDAVARITDALELMQMNTTLPGLWPIKLDASGCRKAERDASTSIQSPPHAPQQLTWVPVSHDGPVEVSHPVQASKTEQETTPARNVADPTKLQANSTAPGSAPKPQATGTFSVECETQGLSFEPHTSFHSYGIGGMADSTYEYFPKEYMLLGGANDQYQTMYENAMVPVREKLLYRPMTKEDRDILFAARVDWIKSSPNDLQTTYEGSHLGCFAGGMFALGAKLFDIEDDLDIARKLTEGCIWAYNSTRTGIMPEDFRLAPCQSQSTCAWNETKYYELLDPHEQTRMNATMQWNEHQKKVYEDALKRKEMSSVKPTTTTRLTNIDRTMPQLPGLEDQIRAMRKRQLVTSEEITSSTSKPDETIVPTRTQNPRDDVDADEDVDEDIDEDVDEDDEAPPTIPSPPSATFEPRVALSHKEFVEARIEEERLPPGFVTIRSRDYKLRPEAIESVFIMYRITGEQYWRDAGWTMFNAIVAHTRTEVAHSAINDVTSQVPKFSDTMESFWLAETLKYFYLLFSEPDLISLDDFVLNTEAHPFKVPK